MTAERPHTVQAGRVARDHTYDALIVGGGVAGSALAISLARAGKDVVLLEKSSAAHAKMCGEFLSHEALGYLAGLGLNLEALGAVPIEFVRLAGNHVGATSALPFPSLSLSRERLDEALLEQATATGVCVVRGTRVRSLQTSNSGWAASTDGDCTFAGRDAFLATGKHDLHGWNRPAGKQNDLLAFKMYWRLMPQQQTELVRHVELVLFPGGYAGLQPVDDGWANLCLLVRRKTFLAIGASWAALLSYMQTHSAHLAMRLQGAVARWERPLSLSAIPYGYVRTHAEGGPWRLGDQSAVIPSFAGDGMSIALHSARLAARMYAEGAGAEAYQQTLAHDVSRQVGLATLISRSLVSLQAAPVLRVAARVWPGVLTSIATRTRIRGCDLVA